MVCPHCESPTVVFEVPDEIVEYAPARESALCTRCLRVGAAAAGAREVDSADSVRRMNETAIDHDDAVVNSDLSAVDPAFPDGDAGIALALVCGLLESYALNRKSIEALIDYAEREGTDVFDFFDRLDGTDAAFDLERRRQTVLDGL